MKKIAVTMGDPAGVGPEIILRALSMEEVRSRCLPIIVGDLNVLEDAAALTGSALSLKPVGSPEEAVPDAGSAWVLDLGSGAAFERGRPTAEGGKASAAFIRKAVELALEKKVDAVVTAPISKEALKLAGLHWPGHTEMLAELTATKDYAMVLAGGPLRVILVTIHTSIKSVPGLITAQSVLKTIRLAGRACEMLGLSNPAIAVSGLNPHAGEAGMFGTEEAEAIVPAIDAARREGISVSGPYPPDTLFHRAYNGEFDMIVCMYHDQGLIPLKMIAFDKGVNITIGLPIIRTSPDHGTAFDIAWKGVADPSSLVEAVALASAMRL